MWQEYNNETGRHLYNIQSLDGVERETSKI